MFCGNCGTENSNGAKFCKVCGKQLAVSSVRKEAPGVTGTNASNAMPDMGAMPNPAPAPNGTVVGNTTEKPKSQIPVIGIIGGCVAALVLIAVIFITMNMGKTINLNKYVVMEATGYDGYGSVNASVDWEAIEKKYGKKLSFTKAAKSEYGGLINMMTPVEELQGSVNIVLEQDSGLSNGDKVEYKWDVDKDLKKYLNCKVKYKDDTYKISGLTEVGTFDAFADLNVTFSGIAPYGCVNWEYTGSDLDTYDFSCDTSGELRNGDVIKVTLDSGKIESCAQELGMIPETMEKEYTVEGLESYVSNASEITDEALHSMQRQAEDVFQAYVAQNWGEGEKLESFTYVGNYLLTAKSDDNYGDNNFLYLVYKAQVRNKFSGDDGKYNKVNDLYWYIGYENLMLEADGTVGVDVTAYSVPSDRFTVDSGLDDGWWSTKTWDYYGYQTIDELYRRVVAVNMDSYNHEDSVDESVAPSSVSEDEAEEETETNEEGYVLPDSDTKRLSPDDLEGLSKEECKIARNEIYARHGRMFKDEALQEYFDSCDWYEGTISPDDFSEADLSDIEIANRDLIVEYEEENGYR